MKAKRPMSTKQFRDSLARLDLTIVGSSDYVGVSPRQLQRIAAGSTVPGPLRKLLRLSIAYEIPLEELENA